MNQTVKESVKESRREEEVKKAKEFVLKKYPNHSNSAYVVYHKYSDTYIMRKQTLADVGIITKETEAESEKLRQKIKEKYPEWYSNQSNGKVNDNEVLPDGLNKELKDFQDTISDLENMSLLKRTLLYPEDIKEKLDKNDIPSGDVLMLISTSLDISGITIGEEDINIEEI